MINNVDSHGNTMMHFTALRNNTTLLQKLILLGGNKAVKNPAGQTVDDISQTRKIANSMFSPVTGKRTRFVAKEGHGVFIIIVLSVVFAVIVAIVAIGAFFNVDVGDSKNLGLDPHFGAVWRVDADVAGGVSMFVQDMAEDELNVSGTAPGDML